VVMNQAVTDLNGDLAQVRQSYAEVLASQRRMERDRNLSEEEAAEVISRLASLVAIVCSLWLQLLWDKKTTENHPLSHIDTYAYTISDIE